MTRLILIYLVLFLLGAGISYLGNMLGRYIGRQKMSILNLRPRHTSILITCLTGSLIATLTLTFVYFSSWEVKTLFTTGLNEFGNKVSEVTAKTIEQAQTGGVIYRPGEPILTAVIDGTKEKEQIQEQIEEVMSYVNQEAIQKNKTIAETMKTEFTPPEDGKIAGYYTTEMNRLVETLYRLKGKMILEPVSDNYVLLGDKFSVRFRIQKYIPSVFHKDDPIIYGYIDGSKTSEEIMANISKLIIRAKIMAINKGMIENPVTQTLIEIGRSELINTAEEIKTKGTNCKVAIKALKETDNRGPLEIYLDIE